MATIAPETYGRWPRLLKRPEAAAYVGLGLSKFDQLVKEGRMPRPKKIDGRVAWDRNALDAAVDDLPEQEAPAEVNIWDQLVAMQ